MSFREPVMSTLQKIKQVINGFFIHRTKIRMPGPILQSYRNSTALDSSHPALAAMDMSQLSEMLQWGDMILFDYLTGNYDR